MSGYSSTSMAPSHTASIKLGCLCGNIQYPLQYLRKKLSHFVFILTQNLLRNSKLKVTFDVDKLVTSSDGFFPFSLHLYSYFECMFEYNRGPFPSSPGRCNANKHLPRIECLNKLRMIWFWIPSYEYIFEYCYNLPCGLATITDYFTGLCRYIPVTMISLYFYVLSARKYKFW